jgi:predicted amidohydrolase
LKVALIHAAIGWKEKDKNISRLLELNEIAAASGGQIIVNTELATTGYAFESRSEISPLAETIPGPTTEAFGDIGEEYGCYICIGFPEVDPETGIFYNSAALVGPKGDLLARYRKASPAFRENLWAARGNLPVPVVETEHGRLGMMICADSYSYKPARSAALNGARIMLIPANWPPSHHNPEKFWRARAAENGIYVLACNRTGRDKTMDCSLAESFIIDGEGEILGRVSSKKDAILYGNLPSSMVKRGSQANEILSRRRPEHYGEISLDPYSHINTEMLLGLPEAGHFVVATIQLTASSDKTANIKNMLSLIDEAVSEAEGKGLTLDLVLFPELSTGPISDRQARESVCEETPGETTDIFARKAEEKNLFMVVGMGERVGETFYNSSVLVGPRGVMGRYRKVHLSTDDEVWAQPGEEGFSTFDLPFGRAGMLIGSDILFPEGADSLAKRGADILLVPALWADHKSKFIWDARLGEQMHLAIANQWGSWGRFHASGESLLCSYSRYPEKRTRLESPAEGDSVNVMRFETKDAREKRFLENIDYSILLNLDGRRSPRISDSYRWRPGHTVVKKDL